MKTCNAAINTQQNVQARETICIEKGEMGDLIEA